MSMFGDIAREGMAEEIVQIIDKKIEENRKSKKTVGVLREIRREVLDMVPYEIPLGRKQP